MNTDDKNLLNFLDFQVLTIQMAAKRPRNASSKIVRTVIIPRFPIIGHYALHCKIFCRRRFPIESGYPKHRTVPIKKDQVRYIIDTENMTVTWNREKFNGRSEIVAKWFDLRWSISRFAHFSKATFFNEHSGPVTPFELGFVTLAAVVSIILVIVSDKTASGQITQYMVFISVNFPQNQRPSACSGRLLGKSHFDAQVYCSSLPRLCLHSWHPTTVQFRF